jgi:hypothetical protein
MPEGPVVAEQPGSSPRLRWLCAIALLLLAATAVVFLLLRRRRLELEEHAISSMRIYVGAQRAFHKQDWDSDKTLEYATPFTLLVRCRPAESVLDTAFAAAQGFGGTPKHGYLFEDMETIGGKRIDWDNDFALCGTPFVYATTGYRILIVKTNGVVWAKDLGKSAFVKDFPSDPAAEGWEKQ